MGVVYKATDTVLERTVAVKTVNMALEQDGCEKYEARFYQEARSAAGLNHPNIVTVHDGGKAGDIIFMAMEYIEGVELRTLMSEGRRVGLAQAISVAAQIAEGLAYAHERGVVHRDIKPANIMVTASGPVKITDFGIARRRTSSDLTQTGMPPGSPNSMSPDQVIGKPADHRSAVFSLGAILYETVCGAAPFNGENITALMYQTVNFVPPVPSTISRTVPPVLDHIVAKMLAKAVEDRYQDAQEAARDLRDCERQLGLTATSSTQSMRALNVAPAPQLIAEQAKTQVMQQTVNRSRDEDKAPAETPPTPAPSIGIAPSFNSQEATQRLAAMTGAGAGTWPPALEGRQSATHAVSALPRPAHTAWPPRDWLLVGGATVLGLIVAGAVTRRDKS